MTPNEFLTLLGLTQRQVQIYLDLAANPESTVVNISNRIKRPRSTIYLELEKLIQDGFVISEKVGKVNVFKITQPAALKFRLDEKLSRFHKLSVELNNFTQDLRGLEKSKSATNTVDIYKGQAGIKQLLWNILVSRADLVVGFSPGQLEDITDRKFAEKWREEFRKRQMRNKIIFNKPKPLIWSDVPLFLKENVEAKTLDVRKIKFDRMILIYKDVLTICSLKTEKDQYGIEIRDRLLVESHKQMFDFLWNHVAKGLKISKKK